MPQHKAFSSLKLKQLHEWYSSGGRFNIYTTRYKIRNEVELELKMKGDILNPSYINSRTKDREHRLLLRLRKRIIATILNNKIDIKCNYCLKPLTISEMTIDHIIPISKNGNLIEYSNLTTACEKCNVSHGNSIEKNIRFTLKEIIE